MISLQKIEFTLKAQFDAIKDQVQIVLDAFYNEPSKMSMKGFMGTCVVHKTLLHARFSNKSSTGYTIPVPSSIMVVCSGVHVTIDYLSFLRELIFKDPGNCSVNKTDALSGLNAILHQLPEYVSVEVQQCSINIISHFEASMVTSVGKVAIQIQEQIQKRSWESQCTERLMSIDSGPVSIEIRDRCTKTSILDFLRWDYIKGEFNWETSTISSEIAPTEDIEASKLKVMVESRGITFTISKDLRRWVTAAVEASYQAITKSRSPADGLRHDSACRSHARMEIHIQVKVIRTEMQLKAVEEFCDVFLKAVPNTLILIEEITLYAHPFLSEENLGVRSKAEIQCSRLQLFYLKEPQIHKMAFLSLDFMRVFLSPTTRLIAREQYAEMDVKAEWLEVKWSSQTLHAVGGMAEVLLCVISSFIQDKYESEAHEMYGLHPGPLVPKMKNAADEIFSNTTERLVFRLTITNIIAIFPSMWQDHSCVDYVSAESLVMASCKHTHRLLMSISEIEASTNFPKKGCSAPRSKVDLTLDKDRKEPYSDRRFRPHAWRSQVSLRAGGYRSSSSTCFSSFDMHSRETQASVYLYAHTFSLEEMRITTCDQSVLDLYIDSVWLAWDLESQLRVMELVRSITLSAWEMLYRVRKAHATFCTDEKSRINRRVGLHIPMDDVEECKRNELLFTHLISASGMKLHRLYATNISIKVSLVEGIESKLCIGVFAGYDMPDWWEFQSVCVSTGTQQVLSINSLIVKHTLNKSLDYVYGYFEQLLQARKVSTGRASADDLSNLDGILLTFDGVCLRLAVEWDTTCIIESLSKAVEPHKEEAIRMAQKYWRPQHPTFSQYFQEFTTRTRRQNLWIRVTDCNVECLDDPLASWLQRIHPIWVEALEEREMMKSQMLIFEDPSKPSDPSADVRNDVFASKAWIKRVKAVTNTYKHDKKRQYYTEDMRERIDIQSVIPSNGFIFSLSVKQVSLDLDHQITPSRARLPSHSSALIEANNVSFYIRNFSVPLLAIDQFRFDANVKKESQLSIESDWKYFVFIEANILTPVIAFSPKQLPSIVELWKLIARSCVTKPSNTPKPFIWDILWNHFDGNLHILVESTTLHLFNPENSFDSLSISAQNWSLGWALHTVSMSVNRLHLRTEPEALSNMVEISSITCEVALLWNSSKKSAFTKKASAYTQIYREEAFSELDVHFKGEIASSTLYSFSCNRTASKQEMASRSTIVLYLNQLEWLIAFVKAYKMLLSQQSTPKPAFRQFEKNQNAEKTSFPARFQVQQIWKSFHIDAFKISNIDAAIYANQNHLIGIRAFVNDSIEVTTKVVAGISDDRAVWEIQDLAIVTKKVECRICTAHSGSRGEPCFSVHYACVHVGGKRSKMDDLKVVSSLKPSESKSRHQDFTAKEDRSSSRKSILDHFAITQHNPFRFRDTEEEVLSEKNQHEYDSQCVFLQEFRHSGFRMGFGTKEMRILLTLEGIKTLIDIVHSGLHLLRVLSRQENVAGNSTICRDSVEHPSDTVVTPKKPTSLAEDPKFFAILNGERFESGQIFQPTCHSESESQNSTRESSSFPLDEMEAYLLFKFVDCQINFQDATHKVCDAFFPMRKTSQRFLCRDRRF